MLKKVTKVIPYPRNVFSQTPVVKKAPSINNPLKTSYGSELFVRHGISYEKQILPDGRIRLINLDTGDEIIGNHLIY